MALLHPNLLPTFNSKALTFPSFKLKPSLSFSISRSHRPPPTTTRFILAASATEIVVDVLSMDKKPMESETNIVDKAVANLMFNKMEINILDIPFTTLVNMKRQVTGSTLPDGTWTENKTTTGWNSVKIVQDLGVSTLYWNK